MQDIAHGAIFAEEMGRIPDGGRSKGYPTQDLHILNGIAKQPGSEKDQEYTHHTEKDAKVETVSQLVDEETQC